jgi:hypothetical protein
LLSYGNDMTRENTPHECGLGRFCNTATAIGCIGRDALLRVAKEGPVKQIRAIEIDAPALPPCDRAWPLLAGEKQRRHRDIGRSVARSRLWRGDRNGTHDALGRGDRAAGGDAGRPSSRGGSRRVLGQKTEYCGVILMSRNGKGDLA